MQQWFFLAIAIICETIATSCMKATNNFTNLWPSLVVFLGYPISFYFMSMTLKTMSVGIAYAVWSGVGTILIALVGWRVYGQSLDLPAVCGLSLIVAGVVVMNVFSKSVVY
ncbi:Quaternary ammonium compound-resistance protein QacE [Azospirillaceae bacterium]